MADTLTELWESARTAQEAFEAVLRSHYPQADQWTFYRADVAVRAGTADKREAGMAADTVVCAAHDDYITALHRFYLARDGACGFLGSKVGMR
jgi:hypothetical protein